MGVIVSLQRRQDVDMTVKLCAEPPGSMDYVLSKENMLDVKMPEKGMLIFIQCPLG
jgi:hypothetical protein